ncbi:copper amine oxidase N-terminal domain-containing protein, partial [bacterium]
MKKTTLILASLAAVSVANAQDISVTLDGQPVRFSGQQPVMVNNSVLVPLRGVFEEMGARVLWNQERQQVTAIKGDKTIRLVIGERFADIDGRAVRLNTPAQVRNGSTIVPLRFLSEALGAQVRWNPNNEMVMIRTDFEGRAQPI